MTNDFLAEFRKLPTHILSEYGCHTMRITVYSHFNWYIEYIDDKLDVGKQRHSYAAINPFNISEVRLTVAKLLHLYNVMYEDGRIQMCGADRYNR